MKKQIVLAVLLLTGGSLLAMDEESDQNIGQQENAAEQSDTQKNAVSTEQTGESEVTPLCSLFNFGLVSEALQSVQNHANNTFQSMQIKKKLEGVLSEVASAFEIEGQQEDNKKSESDVSNVEKASVSEDSQDESQDEYGENARRKRLYKALQSSNKRSVRQALEIQKLKKKLTEKQIVEDEAFARWLNEHQEQ